MTLERILWHIADCKARVAELAKLYPGCFDKNGNAIVAVASLPARPAAKKEPQ